MEQKPRTVKTIRQDKKNQQINEKTPTSVAKVEDWENCQGRSLKNLLTGRLWSGASEGVWSICGRKEKQWLVSGIYWKLLVTFGVQGEFQEVSKSRKAVDSTSQQFRKNSGSFQAPEDRNCRKVRSCIRSCGRYFRLPSTPQSPFHPLKGVSKMCICSSSPTGEDPIHPHESSQLLPNK